MMITTLSLNGLIPNRWLHGISNMQQEIPYDTTGIGCSFTPEASFFNMDAHQIEEFSEHALEFEKEMKSGKQSTKMSCLLLGPAVFSTIADSHAYCGTCGEFQPFVAIGKRLQEYGHLVRLATHSNFKDFVLTAGLEILKFLLNTWLRTKGSCLQVLLRFLFKEVR